RFITRALQDDTSPPDSTFDQASTFTTLSQEERRQYRMALAQIPIARRGHPRNDLVSVFSHAWDQFQYLLVTLNAHEWHKPCYHFFGIIPVHSLVHAGIFELAIHSWDIRSALEPSAPLAPDTLAAILDFFSACPHWFFRPDARLSTPVRYRFAFTGALSGQWDIVVEGDTVHIAHIPHPVPHFCRHFRRAPGRGRIGS